MGAPLIYPLVVFKVRRKEKRWQGVGICLSHSVVHASEHLFSMSSQLKAAKGEGY